MCRTWAWGVAGAACSGLRFTAAAAVEGLAGSCQTEQVGFVGRTGYNCRGQAQQRKEQRAPPSCPSIWHTWRPQASRRRSTFLAWAACGAAEGAAVTMEASGSGPKKTSWPSPTRPQGQPRRQTPAHPARLQQQGDIALQRQRALVQWPQEGRVRVWAEDGGRGARAAVYASLVLASEHPDAPPASGHAASALYGVLHDIWPRFSLWEHGHNSASRRAETDTGAGSALLALVPSRPGSRAAAFSEEKGSPDWRWEAAMHCTD